MLCSQLSRSSGLAGSLMESSFVPEGEFDPVPESELVVNDSKVVFDDVFGGSDVGCDFSVLESLSNECDDALFALIGDALSVTVVSEHSCLRYKRVASLTRLIPPLIPNLKKRRLKCALTVR
jgi:hypothetical protein